MNVAYPFHTRYLMLYTGYRSIAGYSRKSCISIYHLPPTNVNDVSTLRHVFIIFVQTMCLIGGATDYMLNTKHVSFASLKWF